MGGASWVRESEFAASTVSGTRRTIRSCRTCWCSRHEESERTAAQDARQKSVADVYHRSAARIVFANEVMGSSPFLTTAKKPKALAAVLVEEFIAEE